MKPITLNSRYLLRFTDDSLHEVCTINFTETGVVCFFVREWIARVEEVSYSIFELNNLIRS
jgi:hypothetical protein